MVNQRALVTSMTTLAVVWIALLLCAGQAAAETAAASEWTPPRTAEGQPNLQGVLAEQQRDPVGAPAGACRANASNRRGGRLSYGSG